MYDKADAGIIMIRGNTTETGERIIPVQYFTVKY